MERSNKTLDTPVRVLSLALPEGEWRLLMDTEPEPIAWLRQQIRERLEQAMSGGECSPAHPACGGA